MGQFWTFLGRVGFYPTPARPAFLTFAIYAELGEVKQFLLCAHTTVRRPNCLQVALSRAK